MTVVALLSYAAIWPSGTSAQVRTLTISVDAPRPLAAVIRQLEVRHGWVITYEDVAHVHPDELLDVTRFVRKNPVPDAPPVLVPRGGQFEFHYSAPPADQEDPSAVILALLNRYGESEHGGVFRLIRDGAISHVVPSQRQTPLGAIEARGSILNTYITIPHGKRTALDMLESIRDELTRQTGIEVLIGTVPLNLLARTSVEDGAQSEPARTVLLRTLRATGWSLSWRLLYEAGPAPLYALNIHAVRRPTGESR